MHDDDLHSAYRIARRIVEGDAGVTLVLDAPLPAEPGQFVMLWLPDVEERPLAVMDDDPLSLTVMRVGPFTRALCAKRPGNRVWIRGSYGHGFSLYGRRHLLVGGGSGVASLTLLAQRALRRGEEVAVALGARDAQHLMLDWRFEQMGIEPILATDDGSRGVEGTVIEAVDELLVGGWPDGVYACGPEPMLQALARRCLAEGIPCWVSLERVMKCGLGVCGHCHFGDRLVCCDGPVFAGRDYVAALAGLEAGDEAQVTDR